MKKLDKSILKTVYLFETEHTFFECLLGGIFIIVCGIVGFIFGLYVYQTLIQSQTLDLLDLFSENVEVIKNYFWEVMAIFYSETPKLALIIFLILCIIVVVSIVNFGKKIKKLSNKIRSLLSYWHYHR